MIELNTTTLYLYLFWFFNITCGALIDSRMWGNKEEDYYYVKWLTDVYWLGWFAVTPFLIAYLCSIGVEILSWKSFLIACGMSAWWDLLFVKNETKSTWVRAIPIWLTIPNPFKRSENVYDNRWVIGFTATQMWYFNGIRILLLITTLFI